MAKLAREQRQASQKERKREHDSKRDREAEIGLAKLAEEDEELTSSFDGGMGPLSSESDMSFQPVGLHVNISQPPSARNSIE